MAMTPLADGEQQKTQHFGNGRFTTVNLPQILYHNTLW